MSKLSKETPNRVNGPLIDRAIDLIHKARRLVVFTGAGVSTESGVPDFRSPGGIWDIFDPEDFTYEAYLRSAKARRKNWLLVHGSGSLLTAEPNPAHRAIVELERIGKLDCVITQNIDALHQKAGNSPKKVIELHGTLTGVRCMDCANGYPIGEVIARLEAGEDDPHCQRCGGILKTGIVLFGEMMPVQETMEAERRSRQCDLFIVIGSSLAVYPAATMPQYALGGGARLIIINRDPTPQDKDADIVINGQAGEVMPQIMAGLRTKMKHQDPAALKDG